MEFFNGFDRLSYSVYCATSPGKGGRGPTKLILPLSTFRSCVGFSEMVELDLEYIQKSGFFYDLYLIFLTVKIVLFSNDAY